MTMKKMWIFAVVLLVAAGCGQRKAKSEQASVLDSLDIKKELGTLLERRYTGTIPCADCPGIFYDITFYNQEFSGDGVYELTTTYLEAEDGRDRSFHSSGRWITLRGTQADPDATVIQTDPADSTSRRDFIYLTDSIIMLHRDQTMPDPAMLPAYTLHKAAKK